MDEEVYSFALKNALTEIRNLCPEVKCSFIFDETGKILAEDSESTNYSIQGIVEEFQEILEKSNVIGGLHSITVEAKKGRVKISRVNNSTYLAMVVKRGADLKLLETASQVLIPTLIKLLEKLPPTPLKKAKEKTVADEIKPEINVSESEIPENEKVESEIPPIPVNQLIVDTFGGLLVRTDTVKIDKEILSQWSEALEGKNIDSVEIETFEGKTVQCKVKPLKDSKLIGKGIIMIPEKLCKLLDIKKGELVRVRPSIYMED